MYRKFFGLFSICVVHDSTYVTVVTDLKIQFQPHREHTHLHYKAPHALAALPIGKDTAVPIGQDALRAGLDSTDDEVPN
jgi:hypothetical protein